MMQRRAARAGRRTRSRPPSRLMERARPHLDRHGRAARPRARHDPARAGARAKKGTVGEHQEPLPGIVNVDDDLRTAVSMMFTHGVTWLACVDDDGFYRGYVTQRGITRLLGATYRG